MKKESYRTYFTLSLLVFFVFSLTFVSANIFSDFLDSLTGRVVASSCTDSDGGKNYTEAGIMKYKVNKEYYDVCKNDKKLKEYYCKDTKPKRIKITCGEKCQYGKCINSSEFLTGNSETDGGNDPLVFGYVSKQRGNRNKDYLDKCKRDGKTLHERFLDNKNRVKRVKVNCPNVYGSNFICQDGACVDPIVEGCTDSDALNYNPNATVDDGSCFQCAEGRILCENCVFGSCNWPCEDHKQTACLSIPSADGCYFSWCQEVVNGTNASCTDSDGGFEPNITGFVNWTNSSGSGTVYDGCSGTWVRETYCSDNAQQMAWQDCPNGCLNGACVLEEDGTIETTCTDSDGGFALNISGYVNWTNSSGSGTVYDGCSGTLVRETYCSDNAQQMAWQDCPNGCLNGACLD